MELAIRGEIIERQELLNGTQTVTLAGVSADGWQLSGEASWNLGLVEYRGEGDITLLREDGAELYGTVLGVSVSLVTDAEEASERFRIDYEIDGGAGAFEGAAGQAMAVGVLEGDAFEGVWSVVLSAAGRPTDQPA